MQFTVPPDLEILINKCLSKGSFESAEELLRCALQTFDAEVSGTSDERQALDEKIARSTRQIAEGRRYGPDSARQRLAEMREKHLADMRK